MICVRGDPHSPLKIDRRDGQTVPERLLTRRGPCCRRNPGNVSSGLTRGLVLVNTHAAMSHRRQRTVTGRKHREYRRVTYSVSRFRRHSMISRLFLKIPNCVTQSIEDISIGYKSGRYKSIRRNIFSNSATLLLYTGCGILWLVSEQGLVASLIALLSIYEITVTKHANLFICNKYITLL